jgi:hypothetical protein
VARKHKPRGPYLSGIERQRVEALDYFVRFARGEHTGLELGRFVLEKLVGRGLLVGMDDAKLVSELREWMLAGLTKMANGKEWIIKSEELRPFSIVHGTGRTHYEGGIPVPKLILSALLDGANWRIGWCSWPDCGRIFVRKGRGEYCSKRCSQRMRTRRLRDPKFRDEELRSRLRREAVNEPTPKRARRTKRRPLEAVVTPDDIMQAQRTRKNLLKRGDNKWAADVAEAQLTLKQQKRED